MHQGSLRHRLVELLCYSDAPITAAMAAGTLKADLRAVYYAVAHMREAGFIEPRARGGGNVLVITDSGRRAIVRIENQAVGGAR
jgi:hypothetical protein